MAQMRRGNLPAELTSFVGRRAELGRVRKALESHRTVTLTGTGGVGKTRLALRAADEVSRAFPNGVWFVELDGADDIELAVFTALGGQPDASASGREALADRLSPMRALLVLDGCESLVDECADTVVNILRSAPGIKVLCTSRRPLHIPGEAIVPVAGLALPAATGKPVIASTAVHLDAVALFVDRAVAVRQDFVLTDANVAPVIEICRLLEGLPIAIEFAADRLDVLSIEQLAERLTEGIYPLLHTSRRATREAQRTLRALADSSYRLCTDDERALLARLAVFSGRFQLEAVAPVCAGGPVSEDSVLTLITGLVDKSILVRDEHPGDSWYRLPALLRDYAHQYLMHSGEWASLQRRHAQWCVSLAEQAGVGLVSSRTDRWVGQVRGNHDNIRSAFEFCLRNGLPGEAVRLAVGLADYWMIESRTAEGRRWLAQALAEPSLSPGDRSAALTIAAYLAIIDDDDAADGLISAARETGCHRAPSGPGNLLFVTALRASQRGELDDIHGDLTEALTQFRAKGDIMGISRTLWLLGAVSIWNGDPAASLRYTDEFIHTPGVAGDNWGAGFIHFTMALAKVQLGDVLGGLADQRRCAEAVRRMDDRLGMLWCVRSSPIVLLANDRPAEAAMMMGAGDQHHVFTLRAMDQLRDRCARSLRDKLGQSQFDDLAAQGARLSLREAIDIIAERHSDQVSEDLQDETTLSSREWEVASLIAEGRSNKEIAAALVISTRTAEGHVRRILNKLDLLSRSQVAAWMAEHRALHGRPHATTY